VFLRVSVGLGVEFMNTVLRLLLDCLFLSSSIDDMNLNRLGLVLFIYDQLLFIDYDMGLLIEGSGYAELLDDWLWWGWFEFDFLLDRLKTIGLSNPT